MRARSTADRTFSPSALHEARPRCPVPGTKPVRARGRARASRGAVLVTLAALVSLGCMGRVLPQSAQAGATVAIPLGAPNAISPVGFGGTDLADPQRGELVYSLDTPSGSVELTTRASAAIGTHAGSAVARGNFLLYQVISLVDVPSDAPLGTFPVDVVWRHPDPGTGETLETPLDYEGELSVLPPSIEVTGPSGTETIAGAPTPFEAWTCPLGGDCSWTEIDPSTLRSVVPDPAVRLNLDTAVWAVQLDVSYPPGVVDVLDVYETPLQRVNRRATTWFEDDGSGAVALSAAATGGSFETLSVAFALDDPDAAILDPAEVSVSVVRAWDEDGNEVPASASVGEIF